MKLDTVESELRAQKRKRKDKLVLDAWCWLFMAAAVTFYTLSQGYPIACSIVYSLFDWSGLTRTVRFVGLSNYKELLMDELLWNIFLDSIKYTVMIVPLGLTVSLIPAYLLSDEKLKSRGIYRTMYFIPIATTASMVGIIMTFIMGVQESVNRILMSFHLLRKPISFPGNAVWAMSLLVLISLWKDCGTYTIYWLAGLRGISRDVYGAATVDGANQVQMFIHITLPLIAPVGGVIATLRVVDSLEVLDITKAMTEGGPYYVADIIVTYIYRFVFSSEIGMSKLGYASVAAFLFEAVVIVVGVILNGVKVYLDKKNRRQREAMSWVKKGINHLVLLAIELIWVYLFFWMTSVSFESRSEFFNNRLSSILQAPTLDNTKRIWVKANFGSYFLNTVVTACLTIVLVLIITMFAGYAMGCCKFMGRNLIMGASVGSIAILLVSTIIPACEVVRGMHLMGIKTSLVLAQAGRTHVIFLISFISFFAFIPMELEEAAKIDGCSFFRIFFDIVVSSCRPITTTAIIIETIWARNALMLPLILTPNNPASRTLVVGLYALKGKNTIGWTGIAAGSTIVVIPIIILFIILQRHFVEGIVGTVKS